MNHNLSGDRKQRPIDSGSRAGPYFRPILVVLLLAIGSVDHLVAQQSERSVPIRGARRLFRRQVRHWNSIRNHNIVMQRRDYSCGAAALATVLRYYWGDDVPESSILQVIEKNLSPQELVDRVRNGMSITDLRLAAVKKGYSASIGRFEVDRLAGVKAPVIVPIRLRQYDHFVVLRGVRNGYAFLADPSRGNVRVPLTVFASQWIDNALLVVGKPGQGLSTVSRLDIRSDEAERGWSNEQLIRTQHQRTFRLPPTR